MPSASFFLFKAEFITDTENKLVVPSGERGGAISGLGIKRYNYYG